MSVVPAAGSGRKSYTHSLALLVDELTARLQGGEAIDLDAVVAAHPDEADELRRLLPALLLLAEVSRSGHESASGRALASGGWPGEQLGTLGDFRLLREVGRGGMGVVYEAEQISLNRRVALKILPFVATVDPRQLRRFQNEARAAASLEHPHIVPVHGVGSERGVHYYAMKFIDGQSLAEVIAAQRRPSAAGQSQPPASAGEQPASPVVAPAGPTAPVAAATTHAATRDAAYFRRVAGWGVQAAEALEHAHGVGIVHRDVKPANLMVDAHGH